MARHAADLPDDPSVNPEMQLRLVDRIIKNGKRPRIGMGTVVTIALLLILAVGTWYVIGAVVDRVTLP